MEGGRRAEGGRECGGGRLIGGGWAARAGREIGEGSESAGRGDGWNLGDCGVQAGLAGVAISSISILSGCSTTVLTDSVSCAIQLTTRRLRTSIL